ncbi:MAG: hypothetical protein ACLUIQ_03415 [Dialister invisus]
MKTTINADVVIEELRGGSIKTTGISSMDCSDLAINGRFTIKPGAISLMQWNRGDQSKTYGIYMIEAIILFLLLQRILMIQRMGHFLT